MQLISKITFYTEDPYEDEIYVNVNNEYVKIDSFYKILFLYERYIDIKVAFNGVDVYFSTIDLLEYKPVYCIKISKDTVGEYRYNMI